MLRVVALSALLLLATNAAAQDGPPPPVQETPSLQMEFLPFTVQEREALLYMCTLAEWASRIQMDGTCGKLKRKIEEAERKK